MIPSTFQAPDLPANVREVDDDALVDIAQRQKARYFWEGAHPVRRLARDRQKTTGAPANDLVVIGGSGFGIMAIIVSVGREPCPTGGDAGKLSLPLLVAAL